MKDYANKLTLRPRHITRYKHSRAWPYRIIRLSLVSCRNSMIAFTSHITNWTTSNRALSFLTLYGEIWKRKHFNHICSMNYWWNSWPISGSIQRGHVILKEEGCRFNVSRIRFDLMMIHHQRYFFTIRNNPFDCFNYNFCWTVLVFPNADPLDTLQRIAIFPIPYWNSFAISWMFRIYSSMLRSNRIVTYVPTGGGSADIAEGEGALPCARKFGTWGHDRGGLAEGCGCCRSRMGQCGFWIGFWYVFGRGWN